MTGAKRTLGNIFSIVLCLLVLLWFSASLINIDKAQNKLNLAQLEQNIRRCAVACYAEEGRYPQDIEYICKKYGISVNDSIRVEYEIFADNIMPVIRVVEK